jgi:CHAT domain-containing protein/tetratricopeptide (TPR) repeat protein
MFQRIWQQFLKLWRRIKQVFIKSPPPPPTPTTPPPSSSECEQKFMELLEGVANGWSRGTIQGFFIGTKIKNADWENWLQAFGERLLASPELNLELGGRLLRLGEANYGKISEMAGKIGRELLARNQQGLNSQSIATEREVNQEAVELFNQSAERYYAGDFAGAIALCEQAIEIQPNYAAAWSCKGSALNNLGRYIEAISAYDKAIEIDPNYQNAWNGKGNVLCDNLGRYDEAIAAYDKAREIEPKDFHAWYNKGNALSDLGRNIEAIAAFDQALEIDPNDHLAWNNKGAPLKNLGRNIEEIAAYEKALEISKNQCWQAWANRGWAFFDSGRYLEAIHNWDEGLKKYDSSNRDYSLACGKLHHKKGNAHYKYGKQTTTYFEYFHKAKASYEQACQFLKSPLIPETYLEVLQDLITVCRSLEDPKTNEYLDEATNRLENLILAADTPPEKKLKLTRKFAGLYQLGVDKIVASGDKVKALEIAEKRKNSCLKWMQQGWQQPPESPNFSQMQELLKKDSQTAIIYWHLSPVSLTTFIIRHERDIQIIATTLYPFSFFPGQSQSLGKWLQDWKSQYESYRKTKEKSAQEKSTIVGNHQWQDNLETCLEELQKLLNIERISQEYLTGITQLILIPHRDLHLLPLHHLFKQPNLTITYLPSAQIGIKLSTVKIAATTLLSVENPRGDMLYATIESGVINQKYQEKNQHLKSKTATRDSVINALKQSADIFHFTGHGAHNLKQPRASALLLANNELLTLADIFEIDFSCYSVICLSACETGLTSAEDLIDEYVGLASGFLAKGANYVVSTLWKVNEISAALLMIQFHGYLKDDAPPVALKKAQNWLRTVTYNDLIKWYEKLMEPLEENRHENCWGNLRSAANNIPQEAVTMGLGMSHSPYSHPYHWAGFTITGNAASN